MKRIFICLGSAALIFALGVPARASTATLTNLVWAYANNKQPNGTYTTLLPSPASVGSSATQAGIMEFDARSISTQPGNIVINSVKFTDGMDVFLVAGTKIVDFGLYPGNGSTELADATATSTIAGQFTLVGSTWPGQPAVTVPLSTSLLQAVCDSPSYTGYIGINMWTDPSVTNGCGFDTPSTQTAGAKPALVIDYTVVTAAPEPATLAPLAMAMIVLARKKTTSKR